MQINKHISVSNFQPCGVDYELKTFIAAEGGAPEERRPKKQYEQTNKSMYLHACSSLVRLAIRKLTYAPTINPRSQPSSEVSKEFMMSSGLLNMECSLDKEV
jgi:hypothetical protein